MLLANASRQFDETLRAGPDVKLTGHVTNLDDGAASLNFPVRRLLVNPNSPARAGLEVTTVGGFHYLLADQGEDLFNGVVKKAFLMIRLDRQDVVLRSTTVTDVATGLAKDSSASPVATVRYQARTPRLTEGVLSIPEAQYQIITGFPLRTKDRIGDFRVLHVEQRLGVYFAEAQ